MESSFGMGLPFLSSAVVIPLVIWSAIWKGIALWKAARRDQLGWYLALLIINTVGVLPPGGSAPSQTGQPDCCSKPSGGIVALQIAFALQVSLVDNLHQSLRVYALS